MPCIHPTHALHMPEQVDTPVVITNYAPPMLHTRTGRADAPPPWRAREACMRLYADRRIDPTRYHVSREAPSTSLPAWSA